MAGNNDDKRVRDPLDEGEDKSDRYRTSGNREESMKEAGKDKFGEQNPASSGTTPLTGEPSDGESRTGPGGVEGEGGTT
ncbi:MAG: hypothetical protein ABI681_03745 [Gemmatimonadales bacterium]